jgi:hypothetical protein
VALANGSLLVVEMQGKTLKRIAPYGGHSVVAVLAGDANGAAIGADVRQTVNPVSRECRSDVSGALEMLLDMVLHLGRLLP